MKTGKFVVARKLMTGVLAVAGASALYAEVGVTVVTSNATPVAGGAAFSYTITVTNNAASLPLTVIDPLPQGIVFQGVTVVATPTNPTSPTFLNCYGPALGANGPVICSTPFFGAGSATITIVAQAVANQASGVRTNTVTVSSEGTNPNVLPNVASVQQNIVVNAPLSIIKTGPGQVKAGDLLAYTITVLNGGNSTAINATISDPLPASLRIVSLSGTGAFHDGCSVSHGSSQTVTCTSVDVPAGVSVLTIFAKTSLPSPGVLSNTATITTAGTGTIAVGASTTTSTVINPPPVPTDAAQCMNGGWVNYARPDGSAFKNQGDCVSFVTSGK